MTNEKWLNTLSIEEKAKFLVRSCNFCIHDCDNNDCSENHCKDGINEWLNAEHKEPMPELKAGDVIFYTQNNFKYYAFCVYGNIVYAPSKGECCNFGGEIKDSTTCIKRYNPKTSLLEDIWRAEK